MNKYEDHLTIVEILLLSVLEEYTTTDDGEGNLLVIANVEIKHHIDGADTCGLYSTMMPDDIGVELKRMAQRGLATKLSSKNDLDLFCKIPKGSLCLKEYRQCLKCSGQVAINATFD